MSGASSVSSPIADEYAAQREPRLWRNEAREEDVAAYVRRQVEASEAAKKEEVRETWLALSFYCGRQWMRYVEDGGRLVDTTVGLEDWQVRHTENLIRPAVEAQAAAATQNQPIITCLPATSDDDDRARARACDKLVSYLWRELSMRRETQEFAKTVFLAGIAWFFVRWDPEAGADAGPPTPAEVAALERLGMTAPAEPMPALDAAGRPVVGVEGAPRSDGVPVEAPAELAEVVPLYRGNKTGFPRVDVLTGVEVGHDPGAAKWKDVRWAYRRFSWHLDEIHERYPDRAHLVRADHAYTADPFAAQILSEYRYRLHGSDLGRDRVHGIEYFERASPRHPRGRFIVLAGRQLMEEGDLPGGELPFVPARHLSVPRRMRGDGTVKDLIPMQEEYNARISLDCEIANLHAAPKWFGPRGAIPNNTVTSRPGEYVPYEPSLRRPEPVPPPAFSPMNRQLAEIMRQGIQDVSGVSKIQFGPIPAGMSGRAIAFYQDQLATVLNPTVREIEEALTDVTRMLLRLWRDQAPPVMTLSVVGTQGAVDVVEFYRSDIRTTDVWLMPDSMLPKHPGYKREQVMAAFGSGLLGDPTLPQTQRVARKLSEWGDLEMLYGDRTRDREYAAEEHTFILGDLLRGRAPVPVAPQWWEDHETHIDEHLSMMASVAFRIAAAADRSIAAIANAHLAWHYYLKAMIDAGHPGWTLTVEAPPALPPAPMDAAGAAATAPKPPLPVHDAWGLPPGFSATVPSPTAPGRGMPGPEMSGDMQRLFPPNAHGAGIGPVELPPASE